MVGSKTCKCDSKVEWLQCKPLCTLELQLFYCSFLFCIDTELWCVPRYRQRYAHTICQRKTKKKKNKQTNKKNSHFNARKLSIRSIYLYRTLWRINFRQLRAQMWMTQSISIAFLLFSTYSNGLLHLIHEFRSTVWIRIKLMRRRFVSLFSLETIAIEMIFNNKSIVFVAISSVSLRLCNQQVAILNDFRVNTGLMELIWALNNVALGWERSSNGLFHAKELSFWYYHFYCLKS